MLTKQTLVLALKEAFEAGCEQGSDEATSYEWGSVPNRTKEEAFTDFLEEWNSFAAPNVRKLMEGLSNGNST